MLFAALGISIAESRVIADARVQPDIEGPLALKILSADISHKTDAGLVRLNVPLPEAPEVAKSILDEAGNQYPQAKIDGILVQRMEEGIAEVIVGYRRDAEVGPVVMVGAGGIAAELKREFSVRLAPVTVEEADAMISEVPALALLRGYRNVPRGDCIALARAIRALSLLASLDQPAVIEAEINPVIVKKEGQGVVAVDGIVAFDE